MKSRLKKILIIVLAAVLAVSAGAVIWKVRQGTSSANKEGEVVEGEVVDDSEMSEAEAGKEVPGIKIEKAQPQESEQTEQPSSENNQPSENTPEQTTTPQSAGQTGISEIQARLENLVYTEYGAGGKVAVCTGRVNENDMAMVNGGAMQGASLIKLYVAGCVYENYGLVSAYESYSGETESLISIMITVSDNTACNTLVTRLGDGDAQTGMARVNQYCANHGFSDTHMGRLMLQPNDVDDNYTSVRDCCNYLKMASAGQLQGSSSVLGYMNQQQRRSKIPAGLPTGVTVGNKTGELSNVENDAAIVYSAGGTYVLCVMSENLSDTYQAQQFIARTSSVVYEAMQ